MIPWYNRLAACTTVSETTEFSAIAATAPVVFHMDQFRGSAGLLEGTGRLSVLPDDVMRKILPDSM